MATVILKFTFCCYRGRKTISMLKLETLTSIISAISDLIFKILVPINNVAIFSKLSQLLQLE